MSPKLPVVTPDELLRALQRGGWIVKRRTGSHFQLKHPQRPGLVTVAYHAGTTIKRDTLRSILKQAGVTADELRSLL